MLYTRKRSKSSMRFACAAIGSQTTIAAFITTNTNNGVNWGEEVFVLDV